MTKRCRHEWRRLDHTPYDEVYEKCMGIRPNKIIWAEAEGGRAAYCQHGTDSQVHCCFCHSGFVFLP